MRPFLVTPAPRYARIELHHSEVGQTPSNPSDSKGSLKLQRVARTPNSPLDSNRLAKLHRLRVASRVNIIMYK